MAAPARTLAEPPPAKGLPPGSRVSAPSYYVWDGPPVLECLATDPGGRLWVCRWQGRKGRWGRWGRYDTW